MSVRRQSITPALRWPSRIFARALAGALLLLCGAFATARAVTVSPTALYLDSRNHSGMLTLFNPGSLPEDVEIGFAFGYPTSDSTGHLSVTLVPTAPDGEPSLVPFLRAFPRRLRLEPGQRQVIRIMVSPPAGLQPGEYWGRIVVTSTGGQPPIEQRQNGVTMHIDLATQVVAAVTYRNGPVTTALRVNNALATQDSLGAHLRLDLVRDGTGAFLGHIDYNIISPTGQVVATSGEDIAIYRSMRRVFDIERPNGVASLAGYTMSFRIAASRPDLPDGAVLPAPTVTGSVSLK